MVEVNPNVTPFWALPRAFPKCAMCEVGFLITVKRFTEPPSGEKDYGLPKPYMRELTQCNLCGHIQNLHGWPDFDKYYEGRYTDATYGSVEEMRRRHDEIMALPPDKSDNRGRVERVYTSWRRSEANANVLDVGSGLAVFPAAMATWLYRSCVALDPDTAACSLALSVGIPALNVDFRTCEPQGVEVISAYECPGDDGAICGLWHQAGKHGIFEVSVPRLYGLLTFNKVVEHVRDPAAFLARAHLWLSRKGSVYVEVPDGEAAVKDSPDRQEFFLEHYHAFSAASLCLLLVKAGFSVEEMARLREPSGKYTLYAFGRRA